MNTKQIKLTLWRLWLGTTLCGISGVAFGQAVNVTNGSTVDVPGPLYPASTYTTNADDAAGYGFRSVNGSTINGSDVSITTNGARAVGLYSSSGAAAAMVRMNGGAVVTTNTGGDGSMSSYGAFANGAGGRFELQGTSITTAGNRAYGIYVVNSSHAYFDTVSVMTTGQNAYGIRTAGSGISNVGQASYFETRGAGASGILAVSGGTINLEDTKITTYGASAGAVGASADASGKGAFVNASHLDITTFGTNASGITAFQTGSTVSISDSNIHTMNLNSNGVYAQNTGIVDAENLSIVTEGSSAIGVKVFGSVTDNADTIAILKDSRVETLGAGAAGVLVTSRGVANLSGVEVVTRGTAAHGASAELGGTINLSDVTIKTTAPDAAGLAGLTTTGQTNSLTVFGSTIDAAGDGYLAVGGNNLLSISGTKLSGRSGTVMNFLNNSITKLTADNSILFGAGTTSAGAVSNVTFQNHAVWVMTGNSTLSNLTFDAGTLVFDAVGSLNVVSPITLATGGGAIDTNGFNNTLSVALLGPGSLTKTGAGILTLSVPNDYRGNTIVDEGTLRAGASEVFSVFSNYLTKGGGVLDLNGLDQTVTSLENAGRVYTNGAPGTHFNINGNYMGAGGTFYFNTTLNGDASPTDQLLVGGDTGGSSFVKIKNIEGEGSPTIEGIKIIDVSGTSNGSFTLLGDYEHDGEQVVVGGAYAYKLYKNGLSEPSDGNWYLRSQLRDRPIDPTDPSVPTDPLYEAGASVFESYPQFVLGLSDVTTLQQRIGNRYWMGKGARQAARGLDLRGAAYGNSKGESNSIEKGAVWARVEGRYESINSSISTTSAHYDYDVFKLQAGVDGILLENADGKLVAGINVQYTLGTADIRSPHDADDGGGEINSAGYGLGGTLTWYGENGFYIDSQAQVTWYDSDLLFDGGNRSLISSSDGFGYALSIESGKRSMLNSFWSLTPQIQLTYSSVDLDNFTDVFGTSVILGGSERLQGRLGLSIDYENSWQNDDGMLNRLYVYGIGNLYYEFLDATKVKVADIGLSNRREQVWGGLGFGGSYNWNNDNYSLYGEGLVASSLDSFGDSYSFKGTVGFRINW